LCESFIGLHRWNNKYIELCDENDEHKKQACDSNVGKRPNYLWTCQVERSIEIGESVSSRTNLKDNKGKSNHSQDVSQEKGAASFE
jgi:maltoporin